MATFTTELWRVIEETPAGVSRDEWLGLADYPVFDEPYRLKLNDKIVDHFMFQEIGHETVDQFRFRMRAKMHEIMPPYNMLYKSELVVFDPLVTMDILSTSKAIQTQSAEGVTGNKTESNIDATSKNVVSNFPQVMLSGSSDYASNGADANSQTNTKAEISDTTTSSNKSDSDSESRSKGYQGSPAQLIQTARDIILNIDMMVIRDLDELFMQVWNNGDEYSTTKGYY